MAIGVDIGGTGFRAAYVESGKPDSIVRCTWSDRSVAGVLDALHEVVHTLPTGPVGIAMPGFHDGGLLRTSPNFPGWVDVPFERMATERLGRRVRVANDADCAVLGAASTLGLRNVVGLTLGTGVGGGVLIDGQLLSGRAAGELGHLYAGGTTRCGCGAVGCLETLASVPAVERRAVSLGLSGRFDDWVTLPVDHPVWSDVLHGLSVGLRSLVNIFGPDSVVLMGGLTAASPVLQEAVARCRRQLVPLHRGVEVHVLGRADPYAIRGAAALVLDV